MEDDADGSHDLLDGEMQRLGLRVMVGKGCWEGGRRIEHLGFQIETKAMRMYVSGRKVQRAERMA